MDILRRLLLIVGLGAATALPAWANAGWIPSKPIKIKPLMILRLFARIRVEASRRVCLFLSAFPFA